MNSPSPKTPKKKQNLLRKVGQRVEKKFHLSNFDADHGSLSSLNDLPDSSSQKSSSEDTLSLQNLSDSNPRSPELKPHKKNGKEKWRSSSI